MAKSIGKKEFDSLEKEDQKKYTLEWNCICNQCKEKWHYLDSVEKRMESQTNANICAGTTMCCNPCATSAMGNANTQLDKQLKELKQCPKCKSGNVKREPKYFKQK